VQKLFNFMKSIVILSSFYKVYLHSLNNTVFLLFMHRSRYSTWWILLVKTACIRYPQIRKALLVIPHKPPMLLSYHHLFWGNLIWKLKALSMLVFYVDGIV
jgi:hypothetical protein